MKYVDVTHILQKYSNLSFAVWSLQSLIQLQAWKAEYKNKIQKK